MSAKASHSGKRGIALVIVLWGTTLLALMAATLAESGGMAVRQMRNAIESTQARATLDSAVAAAMVALVTTDPKQRWIADGEPYEQTLEEATVTVRAYGSTGRIDLNHSDPAVIRQLFRNAGAAALAETVIKRSRGPDQRPFFAVEEIASLPGMTPTLYRRLGESLTVHNPSGAIDWRLAGRAVLGAIPDLTEEQRATLFAMRRQRSYSPDAGIVQALAKAGSGGEATAAGIVLLEVSVKMASGAAASCETIVQLPGLDAAPRTLAWHDHSG